MNDISQPRDESSPDGLTEWELIVFKDEDILPDHTDAGWNWDEAKVTRTHPDDPDIHYRIDPATQEVILSAKLVEQVRGELKRTRRGGER
jgi:hypothetical protein